MFGQLDTRGSFTKTVAAHRVRKYTNNFVVKPFPQLCFIVKWTSTCRRGGSKKIRGGSEVKSILRKVFLYLFEIGASEKSPLCVECLSSSLKIVASSTTGNRPRTWTDRGSFFSCCAAAGPHLLVPQEISDLKCCCLHLWRRSQPQPCCVECSVVWVQKVWYELEALWLVFTISNSWLANRHLARVFFSVLVSATQQAEMISQGFLRKNKKLNKGG